MAINKTAKAQRKRRKPEAKERSERESNPICISSDESHPISISSDSQGNTTDKDNNEDASQNVRMDIVPEDDIYFHHNIETEDFDKANDILQYMQASRDDLTTDKESAVEDDDDLLEIFWPIFSSSQNTKTLPSKRKLKTEKKGYKKPVENPSSFPLIHLRKSLALWMNNRLFLLTLNYFKKAWNSALKNRSTNIFPLQRSYHQSRML
ncbi:hypothetical protein PCANC_16160 [Puccinia coronata f. sp. avenae]|uniref:Uncharacterized protein n=1 Tax=Puccinia coronata f. sp. avenae TaxID=200324 RepID=A0A2N5T0Y7_9BASI|nr:hypothetical protein PCANC_16160 [Puccinia coronata f. sp. avenae]